MAKKPTEPVDITGAMVEEAVALGDWLVVAPIALCLIMSALLLMIRKDVSRQVPLALGGLVALVVIDAMLLARIIEFGPITMVMGRWLPPFGIAFTVDLLGALFALGTAIVALGAGLFALADIEDREMRYGFWSFLFLMIAGVTGAFTTGDVFNLYVWFEVLLIASFGLIILGSSTEQIDGATKYTFLNLVATTLFLIGTAFLYGTTGTLNMADLAAKLPVIAGATAAPLITIGALYLLAFGMKAAAFPVNFWLPASYHTPRIIVSALFAGLLTKVGLYALLRTVMMMMPLARDELGLVIAWVAGLTMILGALGALAQADVRRLMGFLVVSGIGVMLAGFALASPLGLAGTVFYALHSIVCMTALYMATGVAGRMAGGFSLHDMGGLYRRSAELAALALLLFFAIAGLPPFTGFWAKAALVQASIEVGAGWLAAAILFNGFVTTIAVGRVFALAFWRPAREPAPIPVPARTDGPSNDGGEGVDADELAEARQRAIEARMAQGALPRRREMVPLAALTAIVTVVGLYPQPIFSLSARAADGLLDPAPYYESVFGRPEFAAGSSTGERLGRLGVGEPLTPDALREAALEGDPPDPPSPPAPVRRTVPEVAR